MTSQVPCSKQNTINTFQRPNISATSSREGLNSDIDWRQNESRLELHPNSLRSSTTKTRDCQWLRAILWPVNRSKLASNRGRRYGFSQNDADETQSTLPTIRIQDANNNDNANANDNANVDNDRHKGKEKARYIIHSVNFGDKNFGFQWMQDSFEDVAISHPLIDSLVGLVVSGQTRAMVRALIKLANAFGQGFKVTGFQLLKAMLVLQKYYQSLPEPPPEPLIYDRTLVNDSRHYFDYALIAYGWRGLVYLGAYGQYIRGARHRRSNRMAILRYLQIPPEDLLGYEYGLRKGAAFQPSYFLAIDRSRKAIVLSIRGTWSLYDAITDLVCLYKPWKGGLVHSGMLASAQWFYTEIVPQIFRYIHHHRNELSSFIITGHSLGGGAASLLTMMVVDHLEELRDISRNPTFTLRCYSYAPVALSSQQLGSQYDRFIYSFICQDDIVGRLSYGTAMELKELVMDTIGAYETLGGWRKVKKERKKNQYINISTY
ncbi:Alpha/Beta hydrolase protein [Phycomyces blakesleeanus]|uniref:sn-1-specific diacylglycerol lipase n=1 Tax=Phycomyces blakesleeanus TaxID=4837 RepID=A0ABR3BCR4_PHYBL